MNKQTFFGHTELRKVDLSGKMVKKLQQGLGIFLFINIRL